MKIKYKTYFSGWVYVNYETALKIAIHMYKHAGNITIEKINKRFDGVVFNEDVIRSGYSESLK